MNVIGAWLPSLTSALMTPPRRLESRTMRSQNCWPYAIRSPSAGQEFTHLLGGAPINREQVTRPAQDSLLMQRRYGGRDAGPGFTEGNRVNRDFFSVTSVGSCSRPVCGAAQYLGTE